MDRSESGSEQEQQEARSPDYQDQRQHRPGEVQGRRRVVVALIGQRPAIPLVPLVAQPAIHVYMDELSAR